MGEAINRRRFLGYSTAAAGAIMAGRNSLRADSFKTTLHKALIGKPNPRVLAEWKAAGFEGMESKLWNIPPDQAAAARREAEKLDMHIHSVMFGWASFNQQSNFEQDLQRVTTALRACQGYGSDALLLVTCRILRSNSTKRPATCAVWLPATTHPIATTWRPTTRPWMPRAGPWKSSFPWPRSAA